jgi:hypothetical protein
MQKSSYEGQPRRYPLPCGQAGPEPDRSKTASAGSEEALQ